MKPTGSTSCSLAGMANLRTSPKFPCLALHLLLSFTFSLQTFPSVHASFLSCLSLHAPNSNLSRLLYTPNTPSYSSLLNSSIQNLRFAFPTTTKPLLILSPADELQVRASVICCRRHGLRIRVRSGGHDYEGLSYRSDESSRFALVDLANIRAVHVDTGRATAWVDSGAILGELYYAIARRSSTLGFPAGTCPTVGVGGHLSGGGFGPLWRRYALAADNVIDAKMVDANGTLLDRESMGEDLFWAIRGGGGGGSFGIVISWKLRLVPVPQTLSSFTITRTKEQGAVHLINKWQLIAPNLQQDIYLEVDMLANNTKPKAVFRSLFLGRCSLLLSHMRESFPELSLEREDCTEVSWIRSVLKFAGYSDEEPLEILLDRGMQPKLFVKGKSDYVQDPIPLEGWARIWEMLMEEGAGPIYMDPLGGRMSEIMESELPYPHRKGNLYNIQYLVRWTDGGSVASEEHLGWIRRMFGYMTPYVSKNPRCAYSNFRDLDLGKNKERETTYLSARVWGRKYFKGNFRRLAVVKGRVDAEQYFWNEQSIPPLVVASGSKLGRRFPASRTHQGPSIAWIPPVAKKVSNRSVR